MTAGSKKTITLTPATDLSTKEGYGVTMTAGVATIGASATVPHKGIILQGSTTSGKCTIALEDYHEPVFVKVTGTVTQGDYLQQATDGSYVVDAGSGARCLGAIALEAGVSGDLIRAALITHVTIAS